MALRYSFGMGKEADMVDAAISGALARGLRTADIAARGEATVGTGEMGAAIAEEIEKAAA
jgi:3-isopropylmalate dehydrogenase